MIPDCRPVYTCTKTNMKHSSYRSVGLMGWQLKFLNMTTTLNLSMWFLDFCARRNALKSSCCPLKVHLQVSLSFISWMRVQSAQIELLLKKDNLPDWEPSQTYCWDWLPAAVRLYNKPLTHEHQVKFLSQRQIFTCTLLQHDDDSLAISRWLHAYSLLVHQTVEAERVPGLQVVGLLSHEGI